MSLLALWASIAVPAAGGDRYVVRMSEQDPRSVEVNADLTLEDGVLWMNDGGDQGLPEGWAGFVTALEVRDATGRPRVIEPDGLSRWRLVGGEGERVAVRYEVRLEHDRTPLNFGDNGAAYARGGAVMWAGRALFVAGRKTDDVEVRFELPEGWAVTTPWLAVGEVSFRPASSDDLLNSAFMAGGHIEEVIREGALELRLALAGEQVTASRERFASELRKYLGYFQETLGPAPQRSMIVIAADSPYWGGEVMGRAISLSVGGPVSGPDPMLAHLFAHEIVHLWGLDINFDQTVEEELYWFFEGMLAEYLSYLANVRVGDLTESAWLDELASHHSRYRAARRDGLSLVAAGREKADNYDLVYSGGLIVGFGLDLAARRETGNRLGLEDLIRYLYREFPGVDSARARSGVPLLDTEDLVEASARLFGRSIGDALAVWLEGSTEVPLPELLSSAGLVGVESEAGGLSISRIDAPSDSQEAIYRALVAPPVAATAPSTRPGASPGTP